MGGLNGLSFHNFYWTVVDNTFFFLQVGQNRKTELMLQKNIKKKKKYFSLMDFPVIMGILFQKKKNFTVVRAGNPTAISLSPRLDLDFMPLTRLLPRSPRLSFLLSRLWAPIDSKSRTKLM